jgi:hypothetical protein
MAVSDWFVDWLEDHRVRHAGANLPDPSSDEGLTVYSGWRSNFVRRGIHDRDVATAASELLQSEVHYPKDHFALLCDLATRLYQERQPASATTGAQPLEVARLQSKACERCHGGGFAVVYRRDGCDTPLLSTVAYCVCSLGCAIEAAHRQDSRECHGRIPHLVNVLAGRSAWTTEPPGIDLDAEAGYAHFSPADLIHEWTHHREEIRS